MGLAVIVCGTLFAIAIGADFKAALCAVGSIALAHFVDFAILADVFI
jgi:hypothetical protein